MLLNGISGLDFELSGADCVIESGDKFDIIGTGEIDAFTRCGIWYLKAEGGRIRIKIPKSSELSALRLRLAGVKLRSCPFHAMDTELRMSGSDCVFDGIYARSLYAELGTGKAEMNVMELRSASFNCGIGKLSIRFGLHRNDCSLRTQRGIGSITVSGIKLPRSSSQSAGDAEVFIKCGLGAVNVEFLE